MKFQIIKQELLKPLQLAQEITEKDNINSYFSYFIFEVGDNLITVKSANRQATFEHVIESDDVNKLSIQEKGEKLIPGIKIINIVNSLSDGLINFESNENELKITEDSSSTIEFILRMRETTDFPEGIHSMDNIEFNLINKEQFYRIVNNTSFAVSSNNKETSMFLTGVFFDVEDNKLFAVATDRSRMSISYIETDGFPQNNIDEDQDIIVPFKTIQFLKKLILKTETETDLYIALNKEKFFVKIGKTIISSNLISGKYYDYKRIIPKDNRNKIIVNTQELKQAILRVSVVSDLRQENKIKFTIEKDSVLISSEEQEKSSAKENIKAELEGSVQEFLVRTQYILEPLQIIDTEKTIIEYGDSTRDLIKIVSNPEKETLHIIAQIKQ